MESNKKHKSPDSREQDSFMDADPTNPSNPATIRLNRKREAPDPSEFIEIESSNNLENQYFPPKKNEGDDVSLINSSGGISTSKIPMPNSPDRNRSERELLDDEDNSLADLTQMFGDCPRL